MFINCIQTQFQDGYRTDGIADRLENVFRANGAKGRVTKRLRGLNILGLEIMDEMALTIVSDRLCFGVKHALEIELQ